MPASSTATHSLPWLLASPASRGLGLAFAQQLLVGTKVPLVATARRSGGVESSGAAGELDSVRGRILEGVEERFKQRKRNGEGQGEEVVDEMRSAEERLTLLEVDVTDESTISAAASRCRTLFPPATHHLHLAMLSPGILYPEKSPVQIDYEHALATLKVNLLGPMMLAKHFTPFLPKKATKMPTSPERSPSSPSSPSPNSSLLPSSATIALLAARVGSISDNALGGWYSYRTSKSGIFQLARTLDLHLRGTAGAKALALALHPGTVRTGLSREFWDRVGKEANGGRGIFEAEEAARLLLGVVARGEGMKTGSVGSGAESGGGEGKGDGDRWRGRCWDWKGEEVLP